MCTLLKNFFRAESISLQLASSSYRRSVVAVGFSCKMANPIFSNLFTVVSFIILQLILKGEAISEEFLEFTSRIQNHSEVVYVTDAIPTASPSGNTSRIIEAEKQISHVTVLNLNAEFLSKMDKNGSISIKFVIALPTVQETLDTISKIGSATEFQKFSVPPWVLALWPEQVVDDKEAGRALQEYLAQPARNFTIKHELFVAFDAKNNSAKANVNVDELYQSRYLTYELYTINSQFIYAQVPNLGTTIMSCIDCPSLPERRFNLRGVILRLIGVQDRDFNDDTLFMDDATGNLNLNISLAKRLVDILQRSMNFTPKFFRHDEWGKPLANGTWIGAVGDIINDLVDICITTTTMIPGRAGQVAFLHPIEENLVAAFFLPPSLNAIRDIFMQPFQPSLWAAVITTWLALASAMVAFTLIRKKFVAHDEHKLGTSEVEPDFAHDSFIWALATVCQQGWDEHPHALSLRAIFISASFTGVIAYAGYSAAIVSTLSLRIDPIQSPEALIKSNLRIGIRGGFLNDEMVQRNPSTSTGTDVITALRGRISQRPNEGVVNVSTGTDLLLSQPYAFIGAKEGFYDILKVSSPDKKYRYDVDTQICAIKELDILKEGFKTGWFTAKLFPFREYFRIMLLAIRERGILWRLRSEFSYKRRCLESTDNSGRALGANDVFTAFMVLSGGYFLSVAFLVLEKLIRFNSVIYIR